MASTEPQDQQDQASSVGAWKKNRQGVLLKVPSGERCKARRIGLDVFLRNGMVPNSLMPIIKEAMRSGEAPKMNMEDFDEEMLDSILSLVDSVCREAVIEPELHLPPSSPADRRDDIVYTDDVDMNDRMFIFNWVVGGSADLERFRKEQAASLADVRSGSDVERPPEPASRD